MSPQPLAPSARVRKYLASLPPGTRKVVKQLREAIRSAAPDATESFGYSMPAFRLAGKPLVWYAGWKTHSSLYPFGSAALRKHATALRRYETSKGTIRFPLEEPLPVGLIRKLVRARAAEVQARA